jgi:hypothetical protein
MKTEKFKVLLYLKKSSPDKSGKTPIMGRITVGRTMVQFSCKLSCTPSLWNPRESRLNGKSREAVTANAKLDRLLLAVNEAYHALIERKQAFTAEDVKNQFQGSVDTQMTLLRLFDRLTDELKARIGIDRAAGTLPTYTYTRRALAEFIKKKFNASDLAFGQLNEQFIREFQEFVLVEPLAVGKNGESYISNTLVNMTFNTFLLLSEPTEKFLFKLEDSITKKEIFSAPLVKGEDHIYRLKFGVFEKKAYDGYESSSLNIKVINRSQQKYQIVSESLPDNGGEVQPYSDNAFWSSINIYTPPGNNNAKLSLAIQDEYGDPIIAKELYANEIDSDEYGYKTLQIIINSQGKEMLRPEMPPADPAANIVALYMDNDPWMMYDVRIMSRNRQQVIATIDNLTPGQWEFRTLNVATTERYWVKFFNAGTEEPYAGVSESSSITSYRATPILPTDGSYGKRTAVYLYPDFTEWSQAIRGIELK